MSFTTPGQWQNAPAPCNDAAARVTGLDFAARLPRFIDAPAGAAERIHMLAVGVVGAGSVGTQMISDFSRMGIRALWICDAGSTKQESLLTHSIMPSELGLWKAERAAVRAREISPATDVRFFNGPIQSMRRDALTGLSFVLLATDNLAAEVATTQMCLQLGLPLIQASVYGPGLVAQIRALASDERGREPCLLCGYDDRDFEDLDAATQFSCEGEAAATSSSPAPLRNTIPTRSLPHLCGLAANLAVGEVLQRHLELGAAAPRSRSLEYCGYHGETSSVRLERNPDCPADHQPWALRALDTPVAALCVRDLIRVAGQADQDLEGLSVDVEGYRFATMTACECAPHARLERFVPVAGKLGPCASGRCEEVVAHPLHSYINVPGGALARCLDTPLEALGAARTPSVLVRGSDVATLVYSSEAGLAGSAVEGRGAAHAAPIVEVKAS